MAVTMDSAEIIRNAFHAVKQLGVTSGAKVTVSGLTLTVTQPDGDVETWQFMRTSTHGGDAYMSVEHHTRRARAILTDDELRTEVRRIVAWVLS